MIILIDNYDSFTWNLYHFFGDLEQEVKVVRNDKIRKVKGRHPKYSVVGNPPGGKYWRNQTVYFEAPRSGYGTLSLNIYNPSYKDARSTWTISDIVIKPRKDVGYNPTFFTLDKEL